jgi:hypothetical protein
VTALLVASEKLIVRLRILQKLQMQCRERGETTIDLNVAELFEPADAEAIVAWETAIAGCTGAVPLPFEVAG